MLKAKKLLVAGLSATTIVSMVSLTASPADAGYRYHSYRSYPIYTHRHRSNGGAIAAGVIGGLALGALATGAARPAYGYGGCYEVDRRYVDQWGRPFLRRETVCE